MTTNDQSDDDHQDELSKNIDDGGGCCEAWEVAESLRGSTSDRRSFMKSLGGATASAAGLGMVNPVSAAETGPFAPLTRERITGTDAREVIENALSNDLTQSVIGTLPAKEFARKESTAYRITSETGQSPITQVLVPEVDSDSKLGFATDGNSTSVGIQLDQGRIAQATSHPEQPDSNGDVVYKRSPEENSRQRILQLVREHEKYRETARRLPSDVRAKAKNAKVMLNDEQNVAYVYLPVSAKKGQLHTDGGGKGAIVASVDMDEGAVTTASSGCFGEAFTCLVTSTDFWGICWACCCKWCYAAKHPYICAPCAGCVGFTGLKCFVESDPCNPW